MKHTFCLYFSVLLLSISTIASGQKAVDIQADLIQLDENGFRLLKESNTGKYYDFDFELNKLNDFDHHVSIYSNLIDSSKLSNREMPINSLPNFSLDDLTTESIYLYHEYDKNFISQLNYFNEGFFTLRTYRFEAIFNDGAYIYEWVKQETYYYNFFILRVNQDKELIVLLERYERSTYTDVAGVIGKTKDGYVGILDGKFYTQGNDIEKKQSSNKKYSFDDPDDKIYRVTENNQLRDFVFNQRFIDKDYDTLYINNGFIIGLKGNRYDIYNHRLNSIGLPNTRSVHSTAEHGCQILVGNKIKWLKKSGHVSDEMEKITFMVCGTVSTSKQEISKVNDQFKLTKLIDHFDGKEPIVSSFMFKNHNYSDIWFLNGAKTVSYDGNSGINATYDIPGEEYKLLIVKDKDKYGLVEYESMDEKVVLNEILNAQYDSIIFKNYYHPILLKKDNLYGYYKLNEKMRYKSISAFDKSFARFTLPSGKKGWLDINGREYMDK